MDQTTETTRAANHALNTAMNAPQPLDGANDQGAAAHYVHQTRLGLFSWIMFDFGRTLWSYSLITAGTFSLWITKDLGASEVFYSIAFGLSLLIIAIASPALGAISDKAGRRLPFLVVVTAMIVGGTALLSQTNNVWFGVLLFIVAGVGYQSTNVFYDALLGTVATPQHRGRISGFGMAAGYLGTVTWGAFTIYYLSDIFGENHALYFLPTAIAVLITVIPCFFFVRERQPNPDQKVTGADIRVAFIQLWHSIQTVRTQQRNLGRYLLARMFYADAANTAISFMALYAGVVIGMTTKEINVFGTFAATFAVVGALTFGWLADRYGPKPMLYIVLVGWLIVIAGAMLAPGGDTGKFILYALGPVAGLSLGSLRACDRTFLVRISPPEMVGESFGLFSLIGDAATILGQACVIIGTVVLAAVVEKTFGYRVSLALIIVLLGVGALLLRNVSDKVYQRAT